MPQVESALDAISVDPRSTTSAEFHELIKTDSARWKAVADKANIKLD
jgi:tripartite-type tricarboxylate transporter receptor subunit TctC